MMLNRIIRYFRSLKIAYFIQYNGSDYRTYVESIIEGKKLIYENPRRRKIVGLYSIDGNGDIKLVWKHRRNNKIKYQDNV
jgi:hypothetical protein